MAVELPRVAIADDDVLLREGIASLLEQHGFKIVGQAGDATELLALVEKHEPELVIVDIRMPPNHETEGLEAARVIRQRFPTAGILVLSAHVGSSILALETARHRGTDRLSAQEPASPTWMTSSRRSDASLRGGSVVDPGLVQELVACAPAERSARDPDTPGARGLVPDGRGLVDGARRLSPTVSPVSGNTVEKNTREQHAS
jgi:serine/threonine-protein kinase PknK